MICRAKPYEGELPYIFFSYCHKDADSVYPIIETMAEKGYRIWYDDGIHPGDNWIETIAEHISECTVCIAAVTSNSVVSHNCRNEVNFSLEHSKPLIPVIIEDFPMTLGVRLQLSSCQYIRKFEHHNELEFYKKLFAAENLSACKGENSYIDKSYYTDRKIAALEDERNKVLKNREKQIEQAAKSLRTDRWHEHLDANGSVNHGIKDPVSQNVSTESDEKADSKSVHRKTPKRAIVKRTKNLKHEEENDDNVAIYERQPHIGIDVLEDDTISDEGLTEMEDDELTVMEDFEDDDTYDDEKTEIEGGDRTKQTGAKSRKALRSAVLVHIATSKMYPILKPTTKIGRKQEQCDIVIADRTISSLHAELVQNNRGFYICDMDSSNGTILNGAELEGMEPTRIENDSWIQFSNQLFYFAMDNVAEMIMRQNMFAYLECVDTDELMPLVFSSLALGRSNVWQKGTFSDKRTSRHHGVISFKGDCYVLSVDSESANGIFYNGRRLHEGDEVELKENDEIRTGSVYHIRIHYIDLKNGGRAKWEE